MTGARESDQAWAGMRQSGLLASHENKGVTRRYLVRRTSQPPTEKPQGKLKKKGRPGLPGVASLELRFLLVHIAKVRVLD